MMLVFLFAVMMALLGAFCGAVGGLNHRGHRLPPGVTMGILVAVLGLAFFGKWLISVEAVSVGKMIAIASVAFLPTAVVTLIGFARFGE